MLQCKSIFEKKGYKFVESGIIKLNDNPDYCLRIVILNIMD